VPAGKQTSVIPQNFMKKFPAVAAFELSQFFQFSQSPELAMNLK
jgi:hypothetical protein